MSTSRRGFLRGAAVPRTTTGASATGAAAPDLSGMAPLAAPRLASAMDGSAVLAGFRTPPADALPRVRWHWMNQNISAGTELKPAAC